MAGLLDGMLDSDSLRLGLGLLAAGGPTTDPNRTGIGQRLQEGLGSFDVYKQNALKQKMLEAQMQQAMEQAAQQKAERARQQTIQQGMGQFFKPGQQALAPLMGDAATGIMPSAGKAAIAPSFDAAGAAQFLAQNGEYDKALPMLQSLQPKERTLKEGETVFMGDKPFLSVPKAPKEIDPNKPFMVIDGKIVSNEAYQAFDLKSKRAGATNVNVSNSTTQEKEQSKKWGEGLGATRIEINNAGFKAPRTLTNVARMDELLQGVDGGKFAPMGANIASAAGSFGINIDPKLGNKQAAEALAIEMALAQKPVGSGAMSDPEFDNYLSTVPGLAKTPEGRKQISATIKAKAQRDIEIAKMARAYAKANNGVIDDDFLESVAQYQAKNPVVFQQQNSDKGVDALMTKYPPRR